MVNVHKYSVPDFFPNFLKEGKFPEPTHDSLYSKFLKVRLKVAANIRRDSGIDPIIYEILSREMSQVKYRVLSAISEKVLVNYFQEKGRTFQEERYFSEFRTRRRLAHSNGGFCEVDGSGHGRFPFRDF